MLKDLVTSKLKSVWDKLSQVEKLNMPRGPYFKEEEIPLPNTHDLQDARGLESPKYSII